MIHGDLFRYRHFKRRPGKFIPFEPTVMFIDVVGFTKHDDNKRLRDAVRRLQLAISDVFEDLYWDEENSPNDAIMLPTGDGYGIGFEPSKVDDRKVLNKAGELSATLGKDNLPVRIGINKGPCWVHTNLNDQLDLAGWGIIDAERAMSCGNANHILCTSQFVDPYVQHHGADPHLHPIGDYTSKKRKLTLYNYYSRKFGNERRPSKKA